MFALGGKAELPGTLPPMKVTPIDDPAFAIDPELALAGKDTWSKTCSWCHGPGAVGGGGAPDLRASAAMLDMDTLSAIALDGERIARGMPKFADMTRADMLAIQHFVRQRARAALQP